ncbi:GP46-like surface antigen, putative [Bodo saltans]|uniref:GP46-like surface antigen, putative n=1 Tax=Bodo saltans TaxID=75058 RepID=A0A0S4IR61_BODSA|nr:GP46-like surface antigen, putative [Bodo saltans]|eukprot:CUF40410.1 GP46-like surface antigen, putative [Bodo saltans]
MQVTTTSAFLVAVLLSVASLVSATPAAQVSALEELFKSTNGHQWTGECGNGWASTTVPTCSWFGVTCDGSDNVIGLTLVQCGLDGPLPLGLTALEHLQFLALNFNSIRGPLPEWSSDFTELVSISLFNNSITGPLPGSWANLVNVTSISLEYNAISGPLPDAWGNFSSNSLATLTLQHNAITGPLPAAWGMYSLPQSITTLMLSHNAIDGALPMEWFPFISNTLGLSHNSLSGELPSWTGTSFSDMIGTLDLSYNQFSGVIPPWTGINQVSLLNISNNNLGGWIPASWTSMSYTTLDLSNNQLNGTLLAPWSGYVNYLHLQGNALSGDLSNFLNSFLSQTYTLDLSNNAFTGVLPLLTYSNWQCSNCECSLNLENNFLTGPISEEFCGVLSSVFFLAIPQRNKC